MTSDMPSDNIMKIYENKLDELKYPLVLELPKNYWTSSEDVEYIESN